MSAPNKADSKNGSTAPMAMPMPVPMAATSIASTSISAKASAPVAPTDFNVAITGRLRSTKARTALATPTPPTASAVRPTSTRNCEKRSRFLENCGETFERVRTSQPASG